LELCQRHVEVSSLMETECKGLKDLGKSLDDMVVVSGKYLAGKSCVEYFLDTLIFNQPIFLSFCIFKGNIHKKIMGLEAMIEKLEEGHEEMSLADWKKSKVVELDRYMESKR